MTPRFRGLRFAGLTSASLLLSLALAPAASAHEHVRVGEYEVSIGWMNEPTFVGQPNGVEITITDHDGEPVTDLPAGAVMVVVSTAGQRTQSMALVPGYNVASGFGTPGQYHAELVPTTPGEYTFRFSGVIHEVPVDVTVISGEDTFSSVRSSSDIEFPVKVPTLAEVATRLDRIDGRIEALQSNAPGADAMAAAQAANEAARSASAAADRALLVGAVLGGAGLVLAIGALAMVMRGGRRGTGTA
ncbi:MAG TPA: hypothetical protein VMQ65_10850 [Candidatus Limnocylindria bacterium]|nr:hypothetical protein [Candidatus Limnocylindria bacterium]